MSRFRKTAYIKALFCLGEGGGRSFGQALDSMKETVQAGELLERVAPVAAHFPLRGVLTAAEPWGSGHINDTFRLTVLQGGMPVHYILQRINTDIFDPDMVMDNIRRSAW